MKWDNHDCRSNRENLQTKRLANLSSKKYCDRLKYMSLVQDKLLKIRYFWCGSTSMQWFPEMLQGLLGSLILHVTFWPKTVMSDYHSTEDTEHFFLINQWMLSQPAEVSESLNSDNDSITDNTLKPNQYLALFEILQADEMVCHIDFSTLYLKLYFKGSLQSVYSFPSWIECNKASQSPSWSTTVS